VPSGFLEYSVLIALVAAAAIFAVMLIGHRTQRLLSSALPSAASSAVSSDGSTTSVLTNIGAGPPPSARRQFRTKTHLGSRSSRSTDRRR
jgi:hypothetical protein